MFNKLVKSARLERQRKIESEAEDEEDSKLQSEQSKESETHSKTCRSKSIIQSPSKQRKRKPMMKAVNRKKVSK